MELFTAVCKLTRHVKVPQGTRRIEEGVLLVAFRTDRPLSAPLFDERYSRQIIKCHPHDKRCI